MVRILAINLFNGDFLGKKFIYKVCDAEEIKELETKFKKVQEELQKNDFNCSYCYSSTNELVGKKCQYCGNELDVFRKVFEIFD